MAYSEKFVTEQEIALNMVNDMIKNGWRLIDRFTKITASPDTVETAIKKFTSTGVAVDWEIPKGVNPAHVKIYIQTDGGQNLEYFATGSGLPVKPNGQVEVIAQDYATPEGPVTVFAYYPQPLPDPFKDYLEVHFSTHYIMENNQMTQGNRRSLYGIARYGTLNVPWGFVTTSRPYVIPQDGDPLKMVMQDPGEVFKKAFDIFTKHPGLGRPSIYTYMIDKYDNPDAGMDHKTYTLTLPGDLKRNSLDAEVFGNEWYSADHGSIPQTRVSKYYGTHNQSPIVESDFRHPDTGKVVYDPNFNLLINSGNVWPDSRAKVRSAIDERTAFFIIRATSSPMYENNVAPIIPIYIGEGEPLKDHINEDNPADALDIIFGGTAPKGKIEEVPLFDFDNALKENFYPKILPIIRNEHPSMGNGLDNVIVRREKDGTRHVAHYISTNTAPNLMVPDRVHDTNGLKYPAAWQQPTNSEFNYKFNESAYTGEVTAGEAYLVHGDNGMRGALRHLILTNPLSLREGDTLRVSVDPCSQDEYDDYAYVLIEGVSPFTKRPSVHYRPMGTGINTQGSPASEDYVTIEPDYSYGGTTPKPEEPLRQPETRKVHFSNVLLHGHAPSFSTGSRIVDPLFTQTAHGKVVDMTDAWSSTLDIPRLEGAELQVVAIPQGINVEMFSGVNFENPVFNLTGPIIAFANDASYFTPAEYFSQYIKGSIYESIYPEAKIVDVDKVSLQSVKSARVISTI